MMEYMALSKRVVQFDLTEGRYTAQEASLYARKNDEIDLADKIVELIDAPERRAIMGTFGRKRIENALQWKYEVPKLLAAYAALWRDKTDEAVATPGEDSNQSPVAPDDVSSDCPTVTNTSSLR